MPINLFNILNGVAGAKPPAGTRGGSPSNIAPSHGEGGVGVRDREYMISHKFRLISINRTQLCILWYSNYDRI